MSISRIWAAESCKPGFGFVEFESARDAEDAVHHFNGKTFMGAKYGRRRLSATSSIETDLAHTALSSSLPRSLAPGVKCTNLNAHHGPGVLQATA